MPKDKNFKRMVRSRQAKTGESYTTARRQLRPEPDRPAKVVKDFVERAFNERDWKAWDRHGGVLHNEGSGRDWPYGGELGRMMDRVWTDAFPDLHRSLELLVEQGAMVAVRVRSVGHHTGADMGGFAPSGQRVEFLENQFFRVEDGRIVEVWADVAANSVLLQLGARFQWPDAPPVFGANARS